MTMTWTQANATLNALLSGATPYVMLHIAAPNDVGAGNEAQISLSDIDRKAADFAAAVAGTLEQVAVTETSAIEWSGAEIDASQEITHFSIWTASTAGTCLFIAEVDTPKTTGSDGVTIAIGDLEVAISVFAAEP
jgi:hypothetical protein